MGVNQSHEGVRTAQAIINLALMTGNIGRPGTGANSITGQCNAMGSRLFSNTTNLLGGRDFTIADDRAGRGGRCWASTRPRIPEREQPGLRPDHRGHPGGEDPGPVDRRDQPGALLDQPGGSRSTCWGAWTSWSCRTCTPRPRRPRTPTCSCPPRAGARRRARSSTPSAASAWSKKVARAPGQALADFHIFQPGRRGLGLRRDVQATGRRPRRSSRS